MSPNQLLIESIKYTDHVVAGLKDTNWESDTTCSPWTLHDLLNHVTYEWLWAPPLFEGKTVKEVGDKYEGDVLGKDPLANYANAAKLLIEAADNLEPNQIIHLSYADVPATEYMFQLTVEALIHGWDLAHSSNQDDKLPDKLANELYTIALQNKKEVESTGAYGKEISTQRSDNLQTKLLAIFGRHE